MNQERISGRIRELEFISQAPESNPAAYLAPGGEWAEEESVGYLQPLFLEEPEFIEKISCRR